MKLNVIVLVLVLLSVEAEPKRDVLKDWVDYLSDIFDWKSDTKNKEEARRPINFEGFQVTHSIVNDTQQRVSN